jgi:antirestriction protein ArdC|tara:strand:+ start:232 stop:1095 length:864 start_codon:yes stop_codon:yes gene_type:complete
MKPDVYEEITSHIIELLESVDVEDYKNPFKGLASGLPKNIATSKHYSGVNTFALMLSRHKQRFTSDIWGTFLQWKSVGGSVMKGQTGTQIVKFNSRTVENKETGEQEERIYCGRCFVFNLSQVEGYELPVCEDDDQASPFERLESVDAFVTKTGATIIEADGAFYRPSTDQIGMPADALFLETEQGAAENYYATLLHELVHWTKAPHRLARNHDDLEVNQRYAAEELVAELGSAFLCADFGIEMAGRLDHARYIKSWLKALKDDKKYISRACKMAQTAVDFLHEQTK